MLLTSPHLWIKKDSELLLCQTFTPCACLYEEPEPGKAVICFIWNIFAVVFPKSACYMKHNRKLYLSHNNRICACLGHLCYFSVKLFLFVSHVITILPHFHLLFLPQSHYKDWEVLWKTVIIYYLQNIYRWFRVLISEISSIYKLHKWPKE